MDLFGYGPSAELAGKVEKALGQLESNLINGDPVAVANYQRLRQQERDDPTPEVQQETRQEAEQIEQSGVLGLRREFQTLQELQSKLRRAALLKMVSSQGGKSHDSLGGVRGGRPGNVLAACRSAVRGGGKPGRRAANNIFLATVFKLRQRRRDPWSWATRSES